MVMAVLGNTESSLVVVVSLVANKTTESSLVGGFGKSVTTKSTLINTILFSFAKLYI